MQRRAIAAVLAVLLAGIGAVMLYSYVTNADKRAMAGQEPTVVLVVSKIVPVGTTAENLAPYVEMKQLPQAAIVPGALTTTTDIAGLITTSDLQIGEQVLLSRFSEPNVTETGEVDVPSNLQQLSISLGSPRVLGSRIVGGDKVGVYFTIGEGTHLVLRNVLVTDVQGGLDPEATEGGAAPGGDVVVTFALSARDAEKVVFATEAGKIWLSLEPIDEDKTATRIVTVKNVLK